LFDAFGELNWFTARNQAEKQRFAALPDGSAESLLKNCQNIHDRDIS
jgi:hypothetical protein